MTTRDIPHRAAAADAIGALMEREGLTFPEAVLRLAGEGSAEVKRVNAIDLFTNDEVKLAEHAEVIRALGKRAVHDIIEIGRRLIDAKERCGHGNWLPWLEREFAWKEITALNFMRVAEKAAKSLKFEDLAVPVSGLYLLAAPSTPVEIIDAVAERCGAA